MKQGRLAAVAFFVTILISIAINSLIGFGQQQPAATAPRQQPSSPSVAVPYDIERKVDQLEARQKYVTETMEKSIEQYKTFVWFFVVLSSVMVGFQTLFSYRQFRREDQRYAEQTQIEKARHDQQVERGNRYERREQVGVEEVSKILSVIYQTLDARREAEKRAQEAQVALAKVEEFIRKFQDVIRERRHSIEKVASTFALTPRHEFRQKIPSLNSFADQYDRFKNDYEALDPERRKFSGRVYYIRGIAAHYNNQPGIASDNLSAVIREDTFDEMDKIETPYKKRRANAYYYLGITLSNFDNPAAVDHFREAQKLDPERKDFLSQIVTAEALAMQEKFEEAEVLLNRVEEWAEERKQRGDLASVHMRLRDRAVLIKANMRIQKRESDWLQAAHDLLQPLRTAGSDYYYATSTLAQIIFARDGRSAAEPLFHEAYEAIQKSNHLFTLTEVRSKILLLLVSSMCVRSGNLGESLSEKYLEEAEVLLNSLPNLDGVACTVFSPLSKRNQDSKTIRDHIRLIREGKVFHGEIKKAAVSS